MTDQEIVCVFMCPRPAKWRQGLKWWAFSVANHSRLRPAALSLDMLREVEDQLVDGQWAHYLYKLWGLPLPVSGELRMEDVRSMVHASVREKTAALAAVLRPIVERDTPGL